jgi:hypothetical protein
MSRFLHGHIHGDGYLTEEQEKLFGFEERICKVVKKSSGRGDMTQYSILKFLLVCGVSVHHVEEG